MVTQGDDDVQEVDTETTGGTPDSPVSKMANRGERESIKFVAMIRMSDACTYSLDGTLFSLYTHPCIDFLARARDATIVATYNHEGKRFIQKVIRPEIENYVNFEADIEGMAERGELWPPGVDARFCALEVIY